MKKTVKDVINQLEKMNPNETVFALIYTKEDVKELEHYEYGSDEIVNPYNDELAESVLINMDCYDSIYEKVYDCMQQELSYQVDKLPREESIHQESSSY
jgi:hypothetical protein